MLSRPVVEQPTCLDAFLVASLAKARFPPLAFQEVVQLPAFLVELKPLAFLVACLLCWAPIVPANVA